MSCLTSIDHTGTRTLSHNPDQLRHREHIEQQHSGDYIMQRQQLGFFLLLFTISTSPLLFSQTPETTPRIQVTGTSTMTLSPNELVMTIRIRHEEKKGATAVSSYESTRSRVIDTLSKYGVPDSTITESGMQFGTYIKRLQYDQKGEELFYAQSTFTASVFDFENYPKLAVALTEIPGTNLERSWYANDSIISLRHKARLQAVKDAREKAEAMAAVYGAKLGRPLLIQEHYVNEPYQGLMANSLRYSPDGFDQEYSSPGLMVASDYLNVTVTVYVEFELIS